MKHKIVLVTGSTDGIGKQTVVHLSRIRATVLTHGRDQQRCKSTIKEIKNATENDRLEFFVPNLVSLAQLHDLAGETKSRHDQLDVLITDAGIIANHRKLTKDGYEITFAVNNLAYFLLIGLLLDILKTSAPSRIINVSSTTRFSSIAFDDLESE